jgi:hypothetical protein
MMQVFNSLQTENNWFIYNSNYLNILFENYPPFEKYYNSVHRLDVQKGHKHEIGSEELLPAGHMQP